MTTITATKTETKKGFFYSVEGVRADGYTQNSKRDFSHIWALRYADGFIAFGFAADRAKAEKAGASAAKGRPFEVIEIEARA